MPVRNEARIDHNRKLIIYKEKACRSLTQREFAMVAFLAANPGFIRSRGQMISQQTERFVNVQDDSVNSAVKRVRKKLKNDIGIDPIGTYYSEGYFWKEEL